MAKQTGLGDQLFLSGVDLSGDVGSVERIAMTSTLLAVTGIDKSAVERIFGHLDGEIAFNAFFNDASGGTHETLKAKGSDADRVACYFHGSAIGNMAAAMVAKQVNFDVTRPSDGSLTEAVQLLGSAHGLDWCDQLTAGKRTDTSATDGPDIDGVVQTTLGLAAYLQVFSVAGTSVTVKIQHSDDGDTDPYTDLITFTAVSAGSVAGERKATAAGATVKQFLRVVTTGTFSSAIFAVAASRTPYGI